MTMQQVHPTDKQSNSSLLPFTRLLLSYLIFKYYYITSVFPYCLIDITGHTFAYLVHSAPHDIQSHIDICNQRWDWHKHHGCMSQSHSNPKLKQINYVFKLYITEMLTRSVNRTEHSRMLHLYFEKFDLWPFNHKLDKEVTVNIFYVCPKANTLILLHLPFELVWNWTFLWPLTSWP